MRKKATTFWSSAPVVQSLSLRCHEGLGHKHLPWRRQGQGWSTAEEAAYPQTLCRHWASLVLGALEDVGLMLKRENQPGTASFAAAERASLGFFPKATQQWTRLPTGPSLSLELGSMTPSSPRIPRPSRSPCTKVRGGPLWDSQSSQRPSCSGPTVAYPACALPPLPPALEKTVSSLSSLRLSEVHKLRCQRLKAM